MTAPSRSHYVIPLKVAAGDRFQPTGFPDLGAALFSRPVGADGWQECLHVESPQSMANHLESATWDEPAQDQVAALGAVPFVRVVTPDGEACDVFANGAAPPRVRIHHGQHHRGH